MGEPSPTESPKRSPRNLSAERESPLSPLRRLPQPEPRPRLPVRVDFPRPRHVKAAQVVPGSGRGALVLALTGVAYLQSRTGGSISGDNEPKWRRLAVDSIHFQRHEMDHIVRFCVEKGKRGQVKLGTLEKMLDMFTGGGSTPLEAQRLGLEAHASDLNPVAVLINKALIEIPPKFAGRPPVNPEARQSLLGTDWRGVRGLADDIRYYGRWMRDEAEKRIGHLYPKVTLPKEYGESEATVIAWLWARTVTCPNPACEAKMPLVRSFYLSKKKGKEAWIEPQVDHSSTTPSIHFTVETGKDKAQDGTVNRQGAKCIVCGMPVPFDYIRNEGKAGRMDAQLMAIVAEGQGGRVYIPPNEEHIIAATQAKPIWKPEATLPNNPRDFKTPNYGMRTFGDLFTSRQLLALTTFSDLVQEAREKVLTDAHEAGLLLDEVSLEDGGVQANAYADAVAIYLGMNVSKLANRSSTICILLMLSKQILAV